MKNLWWHLDHCFKNYFKISHYIAIYNHFLFLIGVPQKMSSTNKTKTNCSFQNNKSSNKQNFARKRKRKYAPRKEETAEIKDTSCEKDPNNYFLLINFKVLVQIAKFICCPEWESSNIFISNDLDARMGFENKLMLQCSICKWIETFYTSEKCE